MGSSRTLGSLGALAAIALAGCGRSGFDPTLTGDATNIIDDALSATACAPGGPNEPPGLARVLYLDGTTTDLGSEFFYSAKWTVAPGPGLVSRMGGEGRRLGRRP